MTTEDSLRFRRRRHGMKILFAGCITLVIFLLIIATSVSLYRYKKATAFFVYFFDKPAFQKMEQDYFLSRFRKIVLLPNEEPTVATVTDKQKLASQPFFKLAENGDLVLLFTEAKKAYLFRTRPLQLVEVGPLNIQSQQENQDFVNNVLSETFPLALYNGTTTVGLTAVFEKRLIDIVPSAKVITKTNAVKQSYEESMVIPSSQEFNSLAAQLSQKLQIPVGQLPESESMPENVHVLIILGNDISN